MLTLIEINMMSIKVGLVYDAGIWMLTLIEIILWV